MIPSSQTPLIEIDRDLAQRVLQKTTLFIGPRPGKKSVDTLAVLNLTHCCTLLSEREDVQPIRKICTRLDCDWIWLPIEGGRLEVLRQTGVARHVTILLDALRDVQAPRIYVHCSAGIHRTGFFVYVLLRLSGLDSDAARAALAEIRPVTADQVGDDRLALADELIGT